MIPKNKSTEEGSALPFNLGNQDSLTGKEMVENSAKECLSAATEEESALPFNLGNQDSLTGKEMVENSAKECLSAATMEVGSVTSPEKLNLSQTSASV